MKKYLLTKTVIFSHEQKLLRVVFAFLGTAKWTAGDANLRSLRVTRWRYVAVFRVFCCSSLRRMQREKKFKKRSC